MSQSTDPPRPTRAAEPVVPGAWARLFRQGSSQAVLAEIGAQLRLEAVELELVVAGTGGETLGQFGGSLSGDDPAVRTSLCIAGTPDWELRLRSHEPVDPALAARVATLLSGWRAARADRDRADRGRGERARELVLLQELARTLADAADPVTLFDRAAGLLGQTGWADVVGFCGGGEGEAGSTPIRIFTARELSDPALDLLAEQLAREAGTAADVRCRIEMRRLASFDAGRGVLGRPAPAELLTLPLHRRGAVVASMGLVLASPDEARTRLAFSAANQLSFHLDRVLSARETERDRFRSVLQSMPQAVLLTDAGGGILLANPAAMALWQRLGPPLGDRVERLGSLPLGPLLERVHGRDAAAVDDEIRLAGGEVLQLSVSSVAGRSGRELVWVIVDVTERTRLKEQLSQAEKLSSLGQMLSGVAHELNNPLASVLGYSQLVQGATSDEKLGRRVSRIHDEAQRCQRIVKNLLSFARQHEPETVRLSINQVVESTLGLLGYQLRVDGIDVQSDLDPDIASLYGDAHQLQQVLINLLTNAQHALRECGRAGRIRVRTSPGTAGSVRLVVEDNGPGVSPESRSRIFNPFFTTKPSGQGTGLGLSLVYGVVSRHEGTIELEEPTGGGARFVIELPLDTREPEPIAEEVAADPDRPRLRGRVLVIEDEPAVAELVAEALEQAGHVVAWSTDRRQGLARLAEEAFDLLVLDLRMPEADGSPLPDTLHELFPRVGRLLLMTGDTVSREPAELATKLGVPLLHKPFDLEVLREEVQRLLAQP